MSVKPKVEVSEANPSSKKDPIIVTKVTVDAAATPKVTSASTPAVIAVAEHGTITAKIPGASTPAVSTETAIQANVNKSGDSEIDVSAVAEGSGDVSASASASAVVDSNGDLQIHGNAAAAVDSGDALKLGEEDALTLGVGKLV